MPVKLKTGALLATVVTGSVFGLRAILSDGENIVINKELPQSDSPVNDLSGTHEEIASSDIWEPQPVAYTDEPHQTVGIGNSDNGSPHPKKYRYSSSGNKPAFLLEEYSEAEKIAKRKEAGKVYGTLSDYTFKFFMPCGFGTGWILDYQLTNDNTYPTKWYIATNSHVIWRLNFGENTYKQKLPRDDFRTNYLRRKSGYEDVKNHKGLVRDKCDAVDKLGYVDFNISQAETGEARGADKGAIAKGEIREPKLFYSAFNFLDPNVARSEGIEPNKHFADFSVIEIEFTSPDIAKSATNGFADKYKENKDAIDLFGKPIEEKYNTKEELWRAKDNYYIFGYAGMKGVNKWIPTANFNDNTAIASHLFDWVYNEESKDKYKGFVNVKDSGGYYQGGGKTFDWNGEGYYEFGHRYKFRDNPLAPGSSGAMYVDGNGTAVGMIVRTTENKHGNVEVDGVKTPKYDLILGVDGQRNSYKKQVETYLTPKNIKTWLSQKDGWNSNPTEFKLVK